MDVLLKSEKFIVFACCRQFKPQLIKSICGLKFFKCNSRCMFALLKGEENNLRNHVFMLISQAL